MSQPVSILHQLLHDSGVQSVGDVEHVLTITLPTFGVLVREELRHLRKVDQPLVQVLHRELVVLVNVDEVDLVELEDILLAGEDVSEHILGAHLVWHHVVLNNKLDGTLIYLPGGVLSCSRRGQTCWRIAP